MSEQDYTELHVSSPNNSTLFTDCHNIAVLEHETKCPRCKIPIFGRTDKDEEKQ